MDVSDLLRQIKRWMLSLLCPFISLAFFNSPFCLVIWFLLPLFLLLSFKSSLFLNLFISTEVINLKRDTKKKKKKRRWLWLWLLAVLDYTWVLIMAWKLWKKPLAAPQSWKPPLCLMLLILNHVTFFTKQGINFWLLVYRIRWLYLYVPTPKYSLITLVNHEN